MLQSLHGQRRLPVDAGFVHCSTPGECSLPRSEEVYIPLNSTNVQWGYCETLSHTLLYPVGALRVRAKICFGNGMSSWVATSF